MFWYTGEAQVGGMKFVRANRALRDHEVEERRVLLFEQTRKSYVRFVAEVRYDGHLRRTRPDREGKQLCYDKESVMTPTIFDTSEWACFEKTDRENGILR